MCSNADSSNVVRHNPNSTIIDGNYIAGTSIYTVYTFCWIQKYGFGEFELSYYLFNLVGSGNWQSIVLFVGNTRVVGQKELEFFRDELGSRLSSNYNVILKERKLPMSLLHDHQKVLWCFSVTFSSSIFQCFHISNEMEFVNPGEH